MAGTLSTLGIGSDGALSYDVIDQLKDADKNAIIKPIENKIELNQLKQNKLDELKQFVTNVNTEVVAMSDPSLYQAKESSLSGSSVSVETTSKAAVGTHTINVSSLATHDIKQSQTGYAYEDALMGDAGTMHLEIDDNSFDIEVLSTDSIKDVVKKINEQTDGKIEASLLNVGGSNPYHLVLKSAETGAKNNISITGDYNFNQVGEGAKDASFDFDGIQITRSSNTIDDLVEGLTVKLKQEGQTTVTIKQDNSKLLEGMEKFVNEYNKLVQGFTESTKFDKTSKEAGLFQGNSSIRAAATMLKDALILTTSKDGKTIGSFGLELQRDGTIKFDKNKFEEKLKEDPKQVEDFFRGTDGRNGAFNRLESAIFDIKTSSNSILKSLAKNLDDDAIRLQELQKTSQKRLDDRYSIMAKKFAAYDSVIAKLNSQGDALSAMIDAELAQKQ
jgi:flagellar hook-associated protein 2